MCGLAVLLCLSIPLLSGQAEDAANVENAHWRIGGVLFSPGPAGTFDDVAVKDPSIVCHDGRWHLFYTARSKNGYSIGYVGADRLETLSSQPRHQLGRLHGDASAYAAAPQVFFFRPQHRWYLVFQTSGANYQPVYSTNGDIGSPDAWTDPQPLVQKKDPAKWIDFWVICDESTAYLFFTRNHEGVYVMTTPVERFPEGFARPQEVFSPVHEAVHVYRVTARAEYHMIYEVRTGGDTRHFGLARAAHLSGPWQNVTDRFAAGEQLDFGDAGTRWTDEVSHGEMLRSGFDQLLEYEPNHARIMVQGMPRKEHTGDYSLLPWRLGIITRQ
jgi:endo-1,4-beta-xylanase